MRLPRRPVVLMVLLASVPLAGATAGNAAADGGPAADGSSCAAQPLSQPFLSWGDSSQYELAPNGDFEGGLAGWSVTGAAGLVAGPEPWRVTGAAESQSLDLPAASSATSPSMCIDVGDPVIRFFAVNNGDPQSLLAIGVSFTTADGVQASIPIDVIASSASWELSPRVWILVNVLAADTSMPVQFTFTPIGAGDWEIDDLYADPWGRS